MKIYHTIVRFGQKNMIWNGQLLSTWGERNKDGTFKYDNLEGYEYVDVEYDRYEWIAPEWQKERRKS